MLWSYESEAATDLANQQPLLCPKFVQQMSEILEIDLVNESYMVRTMKTFLKAFSQQYRIKEELDTEEVQFCLDIVWSKKSQN